MDFQVSPNDSPEKGVGGLLERLSLVAIRLASLPILVFVIVLASLIYGIGGLVRQVVALVDSIRRPRRQVRTWDRPIEAQDA